MKHPRTVVAGLSLSAVALVALVMHEGYSDRAIIPVPGDVLTGWGKYSAFNRPSALDSGVDALVANSGSLCPFGWSFQLTPALQKFNSVLVPSLLFGGGPSAIPRLVVAVVVGPSVNRVLNGRGAAHIF